MNSIDNVTPFAYLVWNFASLSTAVNVMSPVGGGGGGGLL